MHKKVEQCNLISEQSCHHLCVCACMCVCIHVCVCVCAHVCVCIHVCAFPTRSSHKPTDYNDALKQYLPGSIINSGHGFFMYKWPQGMFFAHEGRTGTDGPDRAFTPKNRKPPPPWIHRGIHSIPVQCTRPRPLSRATLRLTHLWQCLDVQQWHVGIFPSNPPSSPMDLVTNKLSSLSSIKVQVKLKTLWYL